MRCKKQPCPHVLGTLRSRSRSRVEVIKARRKNHRWLLTLACGHSADRPVLRYVVWPYRCLQAPRHIYCAECPPQRRVPRVTMPA